MVKRKFLELLCSIWQALITCGYLNKNGRFSPSVVLATYSYWLLYWIEQIQNISIISKGPTRQHWTICRLNNSCCFCSPSAPKLLILKYHQEQLGIVKREKIVNPDFSPYLTVGPWLSRTTEPSPFLSVKQK